MFAPRILKSASRQLKKLDPPLAKRIVDQINWLARHFEEIKPEPLKGNLAGLFKHRDGDYRIIYEPLPKEKMIVVHEIATAVTSTKRPKPETLANKTLQPTNRADVYRIMQRFARAVCS